MLRNIGRLVAGAVAAAATTYLGVKFLRWAGVLGYEDKRRAIAAREKPK